MRSHWFWKFYSKHAKQNSLIAGLLGGLGHALRFTLYEGVGLGLITLHFAEFVPYWLLGIVLAHRVTLRLLFLPCQLYITMIPGMYAYKTMLGFIRLTDQSGLVRNPRRFQSNTFHKLVLPLLLLFCLAVGISIGVLLFRQSSVKMLKFAHKRKRKRLVLYFLRWYNEQKLLLNY